MDANRAAGRAPDDGVNAGLFTYPVLMADPASVEWALGEGQSAPETSPARRWSGSERGSVSVGRPGKVPPEGVSKC